MKDETRRMAWIAELDRVIAAKAAKATVLIGMGVYTQAGRDAFLRWAAAYRAECMDCDATHGAPDWMGELSPATRLAAYCTVQAGIDRAKV